MGSLKRQIIVVILSISIMSTQVTYTVQKIPFSKKFPSITWSKVKNVTNFPQTSMNFAMGAVTNIVHEFFSKSPSEEYKHEELLKTLETHINQQFDKIKILLDGETNRVIASLETRSDEESIFNEGLLKLSELNEEYKTKYQKCVRKKSCSEKTRRQYVNDFVANGHERITKILGKFIYRDGLDTSAKRLFDIIIQSFEYADQYGQKNRCAGEIQQRQKYIFNLYYYIFGIITQHYEKIVYSLLVQRKTYESVNTTDAERTSTHMKSIVNDMKNDFKLTTEAAHTAITKIPRDFTRLCDPKEHKKGETYEKLTHFIQAYVVPEEYLISGPTIGDAETYFDRRCNAKSPLPYYAWRQSRYECQTFRQLVNCKYLAHSVSYMTWKNEGYGLKSFRTLDESGSPLKYYGTWVKDFEDHLPNYVNRYVYKQESRPFLISTKQKEEYLIHDRMRPFYICDLDSLNPNYSGIEKVQSTIEGPVEQFLREKSPDFGEFYDNTVRKFSELPVQASSGKFVTGVRFRVLNRIIYMQIQQGNYISGMIDPASLEWKKIDENQEKVQELNIHRRTFNLDDVEVPSESFVTESSLYSIETQFLWVFMERKLTKMEKFYMTRQNMKSRRNFIHHH